MDSLINPGDDERGITGGCGLSYIPDGTADDRGMSVVYWSIDWESGDMTMARTIMRRRWGVAYDYDAGGGGADSKPEARTWRPR